MKVFLARSMTAVPESYREDYADGLIAVADYLRTELNWNVSSGADRAAPVDRQSRHPVEMKKLYNWYTKLVEQSDLLIADVTFPSLGVGIELHIASRANVRIWLIANRQFLNLDDVSLIVLGIPGVERLIEYTSDPDREMLRKFETS